MKKYIYCLKFFDKKKKKTYTVKSDPTNWLDFEGFRSLLLKGKEAGGKFLQSWRAPLFKKKGKKGE